MILMDQIMMMKRKINRKKGPVRAKKVSFDGIQFASGLEKYMHMALKKAKIYAEYEGMTFTLQDSFNFDVDSYESIKYTPDFISPSFIIECKGRANESFPLRWKMFKKFIKNDMSHVTLYKPQNQKECDKVIELIIKQNKIK